MALVIDNTLKVAVGSDVVLTQVIETGDFLSSFFCQNFFFNQTWYYKIESKSKRFIHRCVLHGLLLKI